MRSYSGLLFFENIFDFIPTDIPDINNLARSIFTPNLLLSENDCGTTLGKFEIVNFESEGLYELATGAIISKARIDQLLSLGIYQVATRHTSTCISKGGICKTCYKATYPDRAIPNVLDRIIINPEYLVNAEIVSSKTGQQSYELTTDASTFTKTYIFRRGIYLIPNIDYTLSGQTLFLTATPTQDDNIVVRCIKEDTGPFLVWLANTYAGSVFGMEPLPSQPLPIRSLYLSSLLSENRLQLISELIGQDTKIPSTYLDYIPQIKDPLEKALYMLALYSIYSNVTS